MSTAQAGQHRGMSRSARQPPPAVITRAVQAAFTVLARVRRGRAFHPRGKSFTGRLNPVEGADVTPFPTSDRLALVRLSKAAGLPARLPDVYGLSFRLPDALGPGAHQDVLLSTAGTAPVLRHVLAPTLGFDRRMFTSLTLFRLGGRLVLLGARFAGTRGGGPLQLAGAEDAVAAGRVSFELCIATPLGRWRPFARLTLERRLPAEDSKGLRFELLNTSPALEPVGFVNRLRPVAYEASRRSATSE